MSDLKQVWVKDTRHPDKPPFLHPEHLLKLSKYLEKTDNPRKQRRQRVTEPARQQSTQSGGSKKKDN